MPDCVSQRLNFCFEEKLFIHICILPILNFKTKLKTKYYQRTHWNWLRLNLVSFDPLQKISYKKFSSPIGLISIFFTLAIYNNSRVPGKNTKSWKQFFHNRFLEFIKLSFQRYCATMVRKKTITSNFNLGTLWCRWKTYKILFYFIRTNRSKSSFQLS